MEERAREAVFDRTEAVNEVAVLLRITVVMFCELVDFGSIRNDTSAVFCWQAGKTKTGPSRVVASDAQCLQRSLVATSDYKIFTAIALVSCVATSERLLCLDVRDTTGACAVLGCDTRVLSEAT